jgi:flagellin-like protein
MLSSKPHHKLDFYMIASPSSSRKIAEGRFMRALRGKRAVSPLIATIILIAITVVGGLLIYSLFYSTSGILSAKAQVAVEAADLVVDTEGTVKFSIVIKNTGNKPVTELNFTLNGEDEVSITLPSGGLQPGQSVSASLDPKGSYTIGNSYIVLVEAEFSDGSSFATTVAVTCRYG